MYYFDNKFLMYYLNLETDLKVYVNGEYLDVADAYDISDPHTGYGYTIYGESRKFDYRDIEHIMFGNKTFNLDQLEAAYSAKEEKPEKEEKPKENPPKEEKPAEEAPKEEKPAEPEKKEESVQMHSYVQNIDHTHPKFMTKGSVVMIKEGWVTYEYYSNETDRMTTTTVRRKQVKAI